MAKRGRKPKPTNLKLVTGNPGKRELPEDEVDPGGEPTPPESVMKEDHVLAIWDQYAPMLTELGVLTQADSHTFSVWCHLAAEFEKYPNGMSASKISQMRALASEFGLNPSSRARLPVRKPTTKDPAEEFFTKAGSD